MISDSIGIFVVDQMALIITGHEIFHWGSLFHYIKIDCNCLNYFLMISDSIGIVIVVSVALLISVHGVCQLET